MPEIASVVFFSAHPEQAVAFYRALGVPLADEDHGDGLRHAAADVGGVHVAVFPGTGEGGGGPDGSWRAAGSTFTGFWVDSLADTQAALTAAGAEVVQEHQQREWGCRILVADPDGRTVEVNQRGHCPPEAG